MTPPQCPYCITPSHTIFLYARTSVAPACPASPIGALAKAIAHFVPPARPR